MSPKCSPCCSALLSNLDAGGTHQILSIDAANTTVNQDFKGYRCVYFYLLLANYQQTTDIKWCRCFKQTIATGLLKSSKLLHCGVFFSEVRLNLHIQITSPKKYLRFHLFYFPRQTVRRTGRPGRSQGLNVPGSYLSCCDQSGRSIFSGRHIITKADTKIYFITQICFAIDHHMQTFTNIILEICLSGFNNMLANTKKEYLSIISYIRGWMENFAAQPTKQNKIKYVQKYFRRVLDLTLCISSSSFPKLQRPV